jgi:protein-L-isoaspartate(D-aspartate) O-methyltransferase
MGLRRDGIGMTSARTRERLVSRLRAAGIRDERVLQAMRRVPRHLFVDEALAHRAYEDTALPIGHGQTISQPYIVARMTELLLADAPVPASDADGAKSPTGACRVLEIGTGSGYQTAVLCAVVSEVFSVERIHPLLRSARRNLQESNCRNFRLMHADGQCGWPEYAPFHAILVTAAAGELPPDLFDQLQPGGRIVAPVGGADHQKLVVAQRNAHGEIRETIELVNFVPLLAGVTD